MNRYIMIRRLRAPAFLLLIGALALLSQAHILGWSKSWPLLLILAGVLLLAERAALAAEGGYPPYPGAIDPRAATGVPPYSGQPTAIVAGDPQNIGKDHEGGQS
ncbi:MAG: DUF5668 domain-containing protein [Terracidiphilus sp.]|jgi:hypothetical protein